MSLKPLASVLFAAIFAYSGYWFYLAHNAESYLVDRLDELANSSIKLSYKSLEVSGFPYRLILGLEDPELGLANELVRLEVSSPRLQLFVQPWNFSHIIASADETNVTMTLDREGFSHLRARTGALLASWRKISDGGHRFSLEGTSVAFAGETGSMGSPFDDFALHYRDRGGDTEISNAGDRLFAPEIADVSVIGRRDSAELRNGSPLLSALELQFTIRGQKRPEMQFGSFAEWRDGGGTLEIERIMLAWSTDAINGNGSLALDEKLRPLGALNLQTSNLEALTKFLGSAGIIDGDTARALIARADERRSGPTGQTAIDLAVMLQNGFVSIDGLSLATIEPIIREP